MKKFSLALVVVLNVCFVACSDKGENVDPPVPPVPVDTTGASATTVAKTVLTSGSDVTTMTYQYDDQKRLAWYSNTSNKALYVEDTTKIVRDAQGMITDLIYRSDTSKKFPDPSIDSVVHKLFLVPGTTKYAYKLLQYKSYKKPFKDSSVYTYDAQNRIVKDEKFYFDYVTSKTYKPAAKADYTYDATGNVTKVQKVFYDVPGFGDYNYDATYTYDDKQSLLNLGNEAIILEMENNFSPHNITKMVSNYPQETQFNQSLTYVYTYNSVSRPLKADITDAVTNKKSVLQYFYQ